MLKKQSPQENSVEQEGQIYLPETDVEGLISALKEIGRELSELAVCFEKARQKESVERVFGSSLSPDSVKYLLEHPDLVNRLGGEERDLTAVFTDVASFSTIAETLSLKELVALLNHYLTEMCDIIVNHGGTIDKFEGDAIIAFFGAPVPYEDHAGRAVIACVDMQEEIAELRKDWERRGEMADLRRRWADEGRGEFFRVRMGVNTGPMVVGNMGSRTRVDYTIMGDAVNLAARLEVACKQYGVCTMISHDTFERAQTVIEGRLLDAIRVAGKKEPVRVYEILGRKGKVDRARAEAAGLFATGYERYAQQQWDEAIVCFEAALETCPDDGPSRIFLMRCQAFKLNPPPPKWDAVHILESR